MKILGCGCLLDTNQVILHVEKYYGGDYSISYKTYGNSGYGELFRGTYERCIEVLNDIAESEVTNVIFMTIPKE